MVLQFEPAFVEALPQKSKHYRGLGLFARADFADRGGQTNLRVNQRTFLEPFQI